MSIDFKQQQKGGLCCLVFCVDTSFVLSFVWVFGVRKCNREYWMFRQLSVYFTGYLPLEDIIYLTDTPRHEIEDVLHKFAEFVLCVVH